MNTFAIGSLPVYFSVAKLFTFRWQYTVHQDPFKSDLASDFTVMSDGFTDVLWQVFR